MATKSANWLGVITLAMMTTAIFMVFAYVPTEAQQGIVQRIFYFHVPCAWVAFAAFALVAISGVFYLWFGQQVWDDLGYAAAEVGMLFCTLVLITGSIWAKPIWGTWWTWDSRLTTTLVLWLLYAGYLILRVLADELPQVGKLAAVVGIVAAADVPVIIVSVRLWRTIHPAVIVTRQGGHGLEDPRMIATLLVSMAAFTALCVWLLMLRFATLRSTARVANLGRELALAEAEITDHSIQPATRYREAE
ncbi:MAG TPA: cytochrome c biogenesis protein CcsA [Candidatus Binataceae bacterium]|nr:cytochrome c biogenesis protein CcsA [Candidatus Binataceae bacterium]